MSFLLMAHRTQDGETEAEPIMADYVGTTLSLTLDDGVILTFDAQQLISFLMMGDEDDEEAA